MIKSWTTLGKGTFLKKYVRATLIIIIIVLTCYVINKKLYIMYEQNTWTPLYKPKYAACYSVFTIWSLVLAGLCILGFIFVILQKAVFNSQIHCMYLKVRQTEAKNKENFALIIILFLMPAIGMQRLCALELYSFDFFHLTMCVRLYQNWNYHLIWVNVLKLSN